MRRIFVLIASVATLIGLWIIPGPAAATPSYCGLVWGSLDKTSPAMTAAPITGIRSGQHECFDRLVVDVAGSGAGYRVGYVDAMTLDGSGKLVPLRGGAVLNVVILAPAHNDAGQETFRPGNRNELVDVAGYQTFRQVAWGGTFEGQTTVGLGVRARLPMRVFTLDGPGGGSRVVVDVAHFW
ncbi:AMIN-like domain-containing (lipo)protein [Nocardia sp. CA-128927]|uniref:AMIN-like domain-containing (lipo)protein n=1 Tax=Nocardia sp. CA-128927 TaxID=3239975 RepID=UPI003D98BC03